MLLQTGHANRLPLPDRPPTDMVSSCNRVAIP
jgi:hypothetical protein